MNPTTPVADPLAGLRDYHLPDPVGWWPPAPGWWLLFFALVGIGLAAAWWVARRSRRFAPAQQALRELDALHRPGAPRDDAAFVRGLSRLLRRYALAVFPGERAGALTGEAWLRFLDEHGGGGRFVRGVGRQLIEAPYRAVVDVPADELERLVRDWIRHNRRASA